MLAALVVLAAVLSVESGFGQDARKAGAAGDGDHPALAPPTELLVTAATGTSISLSWTASSDGRSVVGYRLYQKDGDDAEPVAKTAETNFTFDDLECGSAYTLSVEAVGADGRRSEKVSIMSATTACSDRAPPSTPAGLVQAQTSETSVSLTWTAATDNVGVVSYEIFHGELHVATTAELAYAFAGLACGKSYSVGIAARDASGNRSPLASAFITTSACSSRAAPAPPGSLRQTHQTETSVGLAWSETRSAALYTVYQDGNQAGSTRETSYSLSGLACGSSYTAGVEAGDPAGHRSERATVVVTTTACATPSPEPGADTEAPTAPGQLQVVGATDTSVSVTWAESSDNVGVTGYALFADGVQVATTTGTSYTLTGLVCGTTYTLAVAAYDAAENNSDRASELGATSACDAPGADTEPPTRPRGLALSGATRDRLSVSWAASSDDRGVEGYFILLNRARVAQSADTSYTFTGLACGTSYRVAVRAYDAARNRSKRLARTFSTSPCEEPRADTEAPSSPSDLTVRSSADTTVSVSWAGATDNVGVAGYRLFLDDREIAATTDTEFVFIELACGTGYGVGVAAYDAAGNHSERATAVVTTAPCADTAPPTTPADLTQTNRTATSLSVRWSGSTDNVGVVGHGLYRNGTLIDTAAETSYTFTGLACDTSYTLAVDAFDAAGNRSGRVSALMTTSACSDSIPPTTPTGLQRSGASETTISLAWNASTDNVAVAGYGVYRAGTLIGTTAGTTFTAIGLACGTSYAFSVDAFDAAGNRSSKAPLSAATSVCPPTGGGDLLVSPGGSDSNPCTQAAPCRSFDRAYRVARPGQTVAIAGGSYPTQQINADATKTSSEDVVFEPAAGASVTVDGNLLIGNIQNRTPGGSHLRFSNLSISGQARIVGASDVIFENLDAGNFYLNAVQDVLIKGGDWGPCLAGTGSCENSKLDLSEPGWQHNRNVTIDGAYFHDYRIPLGSGAHFECLMVFSGTNITIRNSKFRDCEFYDIFLPMIVDDRPLSGVTIENNWFDTAWNGQGQKVRASSVAIAERGRPVRDFLIRYNSFYGPGAVDVRHDGGGGSYSNVRVVGNIMNYSSFRCDPGTQYAYNVMVGGPTCSPTDRSATSFPYVNGPGFDYHLTGGVALNLIPGSTPDQQIGSDIDGQARPVGGPAYDAGADEAA